MRFAGWLLLLVLCLAVAAYAVAFLVLGEQMYAPNLAASFLAHQLQLTLHVAGGGLALAVGPFLIGGPRARRARHRALGKLYLGAVLLGGLGGLWLAPFSFGGWVAHLGFAALAVAWIGVTCAAWVRIRQGDVPGHRAWMTRSFEASYPLVSWMCWVPNLVLAEVLVRRSGWSRSPSLGAASPA